MNRDGHDGVEAVYRKQYMVGDALQLFFVLLLFISLLFVRPSDVYMTLIGCWLTLD
jgi:hypothetical protein